MLVAMFAAMAIAAGCGSSGDGGTNGDGTGTSSTQANAAAGGDVEDQDRGSREGDGQGSGREESGKDQKRKSQRGDDPDQAQDPKGSGESAGQSNSQAGGDGDGGSSSTATLSKAQYVGQADRICQGIPGRFQARLQQLPQAQQSNPQHSIPKAAIPPLQGAAEELRALGVPQGDEARVEAIMAALEGAIVGLEQNPQAPLSGAGSPLVEFGNLAQAYGMQVCSQFGAGG
jgi:hypothetical protein